MTAALEAMHETSAAIRDALGRAEPVLRGLAPADAELQPEDDGWSRKERLGHLCDLAVNYHQYLVRGCLDDLLSFPDFDSNAWVKIQAYQDAEWTELIDTWLAANRRVLRMIDLVPEKQWAIPCLIGRKKPCTLAELGTYYVKQLNRHLKTVLGEETAS